MSAAKRNFYKVFAHIGALATVTAWGSSFISTKVLMEDAAMSPIDVYIYRFTMAYLLILLFTFKNLKSQSLKDELQFLFCGVCAGSLFYVLENYALQYTTAGNVSLLSSVSPLFTTALMALVFRARIGVSVIIGSLVAFLGVTCIIFSSGDGMQIHPIGDLLALASALSWAIYAIGVKQLVPHYSSIFITRKLFFYGVLTALPLLLLQHRSYAVFNIFSNSTTLLNLLFLVLFCSIGAYVVWNWALKKLGPVATNNYLYFQPLVTMIIAYFVFDEKINILGYLGCALIIGGLVISDKIKSNRTLHHLRK